MEARAAPGKEAETGQRFSESSSGKRHLAVGQGGAHKRGVDIGQYQAIDRYRRLHTNIKPFAPVYFSRASEPPRGSESRDAAPTLKGDRGGEVTTPAREGDA